MTQLNLLIQLLDQAITGIESGRVEGLLEAQYAIYGVAQGAIPVKSRADEHVVMLCEFCLDCLSYGEREREWAAVRVLTELRRGFANAVERKVEAREVEELVNLTA